MRVTRQEQTVATRPVAQGLFTSEPPTRLVGGRDRSSGRIVFPMPQDGQADGFEPYPLRADGRLWSFTVQRFAPPSPPSAPVPAHGFRPFAVGYVELEGEVIVEARIDTDDFGALYVGQPMQLTLLPFARDPDGTVVLTYAFEPCAERAS